MLKVAAALLAVLGVASLTTLTADANPTPVPWFDEPAPLCGSNLALSGFVTGCQDRNTAPVQTRNGLDCPTGISNFRLNGGRYTFPQLTYAQTVGPNAVELENARAANQAIENEHGAWSDWCVPAVPAPVPVPTAAPNPVPIVVCPTGTIGRTGIDVNGQTVTVCEPAPTAPAVGFTG